MWALEPAADGVRVNAIAPGAIRNLTQLPMEGFGVFQVRDMEECKRLGPGGHQGGITRL